MDHPSSKLMLVTGATGLVGSHVVDRALAEGWRVRALVRQPSAAKDLQQLGVDLIAGDLGQPESLSAAVQDVTAIVHCAAKVGDWGPVDGYRQINVHGLAALLDAAERTGALGRFIHVSSLGVYEARDHYGTDEAEPPNASGIDGYTLTKVEAEELVLQHARDRKLPAVVIRPGFIYGPRDRNVLPQLLQRLKTQQFAFLGTPDKVVNNTYVGNLVDAIFLALDNDQALGRVYNITDGRLVTKREFFTTVAQLAGYALPTRIVPLGIAKFLARVLEAVYRMLGKQEGPLLSNARIKFLGLNLDYSIDRAKRELSYEPRTDFAQAMPLTVAWFRERGEV